MGKERPKSVKELRLLFIGDEPAENRAPLLPPPPGDWEEEEPEAAAAAAAAAAYIPSDEDGC